MLPEVGRGAAGRRLGCCWGVSRGAAGSGPGCCRGVGRGIAACNVLHRNGHKARNEAVLHFYLLPIAIRFKIKISISFTSFLCDFFNIIPET